MGKSALSPDATSVRYQVHVDARYAPLISTNSRFWKAGGVNMHLGIDGLDLRTDSLESILEGGLEFATPDAPSPRARSGTLFALYDEPQKEWLAWAPKIWLGDDKGGRHVAHVLPPATEKPAGLEIILESFSSGAVKPGDPIYYRKVKVGEIGEHELSEDSKTVRIHARIAPQHAMLVRANSRFWNASGITAHLGLGGVDVQTESLESMMAGGVAFATPDEPGDAVEPLTIFPLHPKAQDEWERWSPTIWVEPAKPGEVVEHAIQADTHPELFEKPVTRESVDPEPEPGSSPATPAEEAHPPEPVGFFRRLFGGGR